MNFSAEQLLRNIASLPGLKNSVNEELFDFILYSLEQQVDGSKTKAYGSPDDEDKTNWTILQNLRANQRKLKQIGNFIRCYYREDSPAHDLLVAFKQVCDYGILVCGDIIYVAVARRCEECVNDPATLTSVLKLRASTDSTDKEPQQ